MLTRLIVTGVCALCFAIPAVADASTATVPPNAKGLYGPAATGPPNTVKAKGLYGPAATDSDDTSGVTAQAAGASGRDGTNDWRTAAISEAALLAALALASALLLPARRRAPRLGT